jgi:hypothetical protein
VYWEQAPFNSNSIFFGFLSQGKLVDREGWDKRKSVREVQVQKNVRKR